MAGLAAHAIITKGLTGGMTSACQSGSMLTAGPFTLFCQTVMEAPAAFGSGGGRPMQPGEITQLYQPVPEQYYVVDRANEAEYFRQRLPVKIELKYGEHTFTKEYMVPEQRATIISNIVNAINVTKERMNITVGKLKRIVSRAKVTVTNFRRERK